MSVEAVKAKTDRPTHVSRNEIRDPKIVKIMIFCSLSAPYTHPVLIIALKPSIGGG